MDLFSEYRPLAMDYFKKDTPVILAHRDIIQLLVSFQSKHYEQQKVVWKLQILEHYKKMTMSKIQLLKL